MLPCKGAPLVAFTMEMNLGMLADGCARFGVVSYFEGSSLECGAFPPLLLGYSLKESGGRAPPSKEDTTRFGSKELPDGDACRGTGASGFGPAGPERRAW